MINTMGMTSVHRTPTKLIASQDRLKQPPRPTSAKPLIISASELRDFLRCRVRHAWRYQLRLVPAAGSINLETGALVHQLLEHWYAQPLAKRTVPRMAKLVAKHLGGYTPQALQTEDLELIKAMTTGYAAWAIPEDQKIGLRECEPEKWFELPLTEDKSIIVRGKIDNVFPSHALKKTIGAHEYKTKSRLDVSMIDLNLQLSVYLWALRQLYPKMKRYVVYYNVLRKQMPGPRVRAELFVREAVERTDEEIEQWARDTRRAVMDMPGAAIYPNPTDSCSWDCDFRNPCLLRGRPTDLKAVLTREFKPKDDR